VTRHNDRRKVEALFAELKNQIGLRRLRLRRMRFVREQFYLAAAVQNLKRLKAATGDRCDLSQVRIEGRRAKRPGSARTTGSNRVFQQLRLFTTVNNGPGRERTRGLGDSAQRPIGLQHRAPRHS
jgi:Transposase DDE domain